MRDGRPSGAPEGWPEGVDPDAFLAADIEARKAKYASPDREPEPDDGALDPAVKAFRERLGS